MTKSSKISHGPEATPSKTEKNLSSENTVGFQAEASATLNVGWKSRFMALNLLDEASLAKIDANLLSVKNSLEFDRLESNRLSKERAESANACCPSCRSGEDAIVNVLGRG